MKALRNLFATPTVQLGRTARFFVFQYKLWSHCVRLLIQNRAAPLAAALSYYSIFGIVPLAIVVVLIFHSVPAYREMGGQLKRIAYAELHLTSIEYPNPDNPEEQVVLTDYLDTIINRFFTDVDKGSLGLISAVLVIWAALRLLSIIESAFNHMWSVPRGRRFLHRMINYWAVLTLGPLLLATGLYATTTYTMLGSIETGILGTIGPIVSYLVSLLALFLLYLVMPNAKVQASAALWGAGVAALVLSVAKWGFGIYVTELIPYSKAYGVLGLIPLGVFWVYVTWVIVLLGLQLTFTIQHFETLEMTAGLKVQEADGPFIANDVTAIAIASELARAFDDDRGPVSADEIGRRLGVPLTLGCRLLDELVRRDLLVRTAGPRQGFLLARDPQRIRLSDLARAVAAVSFGQPTRGRHDALRHIVDETNHILAQHTLRELLRRPAPTTGDPSQVKEPSASQDDLPDEPASPSPTA